MEPRSKLELLKYETDKSKCKKIKQTLQNLDSSMSHPRLEETFITWENRTYGQRSPLILYLLSPPDPLFVSSVLSAGDASQNTIPLGECLCHLVCLCLRVAKQLIYI